MTSNEPKNTAGLLREWMNEPGDYDERVMKEMQEPNEPKPREADIALETEAYKRWKSSSLAIRETCPLDVKAFEQVRMIEKSAYDAICKERDQLQLELYETKKQLSVTNSGWPYEKKLLEEVEKLKRQLSIAKGHEE